MSCTARVEAGADVAPPLVVSHCMQGQGPYAKKLKDVETDIKDVQKRVNEKMGALISVRRGVRSFPPHR